MTIDSVRARIAQNLEPYPLLFRSARALFRLVAGIRSEEAYLLDVAKRRPDVFFLQIGANDGVMEDPLHHIVRRFKWRGLLLEPVRSYYDRLVANYAGVPGLVFVNRALADRDESRSFFRLRDELDGLPAWCSGIGSFDRDHVLEHRDDFPALEGHLMEEAVECVTFATLVAQHHVDRIDVIVTDTEGYDLEILKQIDFERFHPELVIYEQVALSEQDRRVAIELLEGHGYSVHRIGPNNAAVRHSA